MNTIKWISNYQQDVGLYQEAEPESKEHNSKANPVKIHISKTVIQSINESQDTISAEISVERFDEIAVAWLKHRKLHGALGGPVGKEWGSPDCEYEDDAELIEVIKNRLGQDEVPANLEADNIFEVITNDKCEAARMKEKSDALIRQRDQAKGINNECYEVISPDPDEAETIKLPMDELRKLKGIASTLKSSCSSLAEISSHEEHTKALALLEWFLEDYEENLVLINALITSIENYEEIHFNFDS